MMRLSAAAGLFLLATTSMAVAQDSPGFDFNVITEEAPAPAAAEEGEEEVGKITVSPPPGTVNVTEEVKKAAEEEEAKETPKEIIWAETPPEPTQQPADEAKEVAKEETAPEPEAVQETAQEDEAVEPAQSQTPEPPVVAEPETVVTPPAAPVAPAPVISAPPAPVAASPTATASPTPQSWTSPAAKSPYERNRVVPRIELDGSLPQPKIGAPFTALGAPAEMPVPATASMTTPAVQTPAPVMAAVPAAVGMQPVYEQPALRAAPPAPAQPEVTTMAEPVAEAAPVAPKPVAAAMPEEKIAPAAPEAAPTPAPTPSSANAAVTTLAFEGNKSELTADMLAQVDGLIAQMTQNQALRLQVRAFATAADGSEMTAKRVALSRVLAVRSYMLEKGIAPLRIDVRPLGLDTADRIELEFIN